MTKCFFTTRHNQIFPNSGGLCFNIHIAALNYSTQVTPKLEFGTWMITLKSNWMMQEKLTCILIGLLASVFAWELQEDLLISMRTQAQGLYIKMWRLVIFWLMENYAPKYQILDWQSFTMTRKPTSAPELQGPCKLLIHFLKAILFLIACFLLYQGQYCSLRNRCLYKYLTINQ